MNDAPRSGRPSTIDLELLKTIAESGPRQTLERMKAPRSTVHENLKAIGKVVREGIWVPHLLSDANKIQRLSICNSLLSRHRNEPFFGPHYYR